MILDIILIIVALAAGAWGFLNLTQATNGVGWIGLGCLAAILARLAQAGVYHKELMDTLRGIQTDINRLCKRD